MTKWKWGFPPLQTSTKRRYESSIFLNSNWPNDNTSFLSLEFGLVLMGPTKMRGFYLYSSEPFKLTERKYEFSIFRIRTCSDGPNENTSFLSLQLGAINIDRTKLRVLSLEFGLVLMGPTKIREFYLYSLEPLKLTERNYEFSIFIIRTCSDGHNYEFSIFTTQTHENWQAAALSYFLSQYIRKYRFYLQEIHYLYTCCQYFPKQTHGNIVSIYVPPTVN